MIAAADFFTTEVWTVRGRRRASGFGERNVDDMLQVWVDVVYLDDAEFNRLVEERKGTPMSTSSGPPQQP